jgi:hypothetical protein
MSETPVEHQTVIDKHRGEQLGSGESGARGARSQSLKAGGAFLKALAADLGAVASRLGSLLAAGHRRPEPPPSRIPSPRPGFGRVVWRVGMVFLGVLLLSSGAISAAMLWVIFGSPLEPRHGDPNTPGLRAEATTDASRPRTGAVNAAAPSRPDAGPSAEATIPPVPSSAAPAEQQKSAEETKAEAPIQPGPASAAPAEQQKPAEEATAVTEAGSNQPQPAQTQPQPAPTGTQDHGPGTGQQATSGTLTDQRPGMRCSADLCAATYKSFNAADCTYQPNGGGPRNICELGAPPGAARPQPSPVATDPSPKAVDTRSAAVVQSTANSATPDQAGSQCNRSLCAATYKSFNAADCTYAPLGGGPRAICELSKGPADAQQQTLRAPADSSDSPPEADDMPVAGMVREIAEPATPDDAGAQCNRSRCAATYQSFHAADCTYQPQGGGARRICEP